MFPASLIAVVSVSESRMGSCGWGVSCRGRSFGGGGMIRYWRAGGSSWYVNAVGVSVLGPSVVLGDGWVVSVVVLGDGIWLCVVENE